jgi:hypothetical protein
VSGRRLRAWSAALLIAGATLGTLTDRIPARSAVRAGDYWVLSGDFHVHAFPGDGALAPWVLRDEAARAGLDAAFFDRARRVNAGIAAIGSSDFHAFPPELGRCRTYLFVRARTKAGVLDAIRSGRTLAVDGDGGLTGDPALIQLLGDVRPVGRVDSHPAWRTLSVALSWLGAAGLVVLGGRRSGSRV